MRLTGTETTPVAATARNAERQRRGEDGATTATRLRDYETNETTGDGTERGAATTRRGRCRNGNATNETTGDGTATNALRGRRRRGPGSKTHRVASTQ